MYSGGISDKLGNKYEIKIVVDRLIDVIRGELGWLRFEGIIEDYNGFEFAVGKGEVTEWFQTKIKASNGNWTINALKKEGVLSAFSSRLKAKEGDNCYFISEHPANDLDRLSSKARVANSVDEFINSLGQGHKQNFIDFSNSLNVEVEDAFQILRRSYFNVLPEKDLNTIINTKMKLIFDGRHEHIEGLLRAYLENNFNKVIDTETIRDYLKKTNIGFKDWTLDPTLQEKIEQQTKRYLDTYIPFGAGGIEINRQETSQLIEHIEQLRGPKVILLTGDAGVGKSGIIRELITHLNQENIAHLAFRIDQHLSCNTSEQIGFELSGRNESPVITLRGLSQNEQSVLIVDQIDSISEVSGRNGALKSAILEFLNEIRGANIKIIFVCRNFDLENDSRLKILEEDDQGVARIKVDHLRWEEDICPVLEKKDVDPDALSNEQKSLLSLPLNLSLYLESDTHSIDFNNRNDLFEMLWQKKEQSLRNQGPIQWSMVQPLKKLSDWMSSKQTLIAPSLILDEFPCAREFLCSEGLIIEENKKINFFHESFFDYVYARTFLDANNTIVSLLLSTEQHLFRRTQARQILETLREHDVNEYLNQLNDILSNDSVRYHIKLAVTQWLASLPNPTEAEYKIALSLDNNDASFSRLFRTILFGSAGWFDVLASSGWIKKNLEAAAESKQEDALHCLFQKMSERPKAGAEILKKWWNKDFKKGLKIIENSFYTNKVKNKDEAHHIENLFCEILESNPDGLFDHQQRNREFFLGNWCTENPQSSAKILRAFFTAWLNAHPNTHPFSSNHFNDMDHHYFSEIIEKDPDQFILGCIDLFNKSIEISLENKKKGQYDSAFDTIYQNMEYGGYRLIGLFRDSLRKIAKTDPNTVAQYLSQLPPNKHTVFLHFHLESIAENSQSLIGQFSSILSETDLLGAGYQGMKWSSFANASRAVLPYLNESLRQKIWDIIQSHTPEIDCAKRKVKDSFPIDRKDRKWIVHDLNQSGYQQWCILETIGEDYLNDKMKELLNQLRRKFSNRELPRPEDFEIKGGWVRSPISKDYADYMSDRQWLSAIKKYSENNTRSFHDYCIGGAEQLASVLRECTKKDPERFARFAISLSEETNMIYFSRILTGLREAKNCNVENLKEIINVAHNYTDRPFGQEIAYLINQYPEICEDKKYLDILIWYARNGTARDDVVTSKGDDADETIARNIHDLNTHRSDLHHSGINDVRGSAVLGLAAVYWEFPEYYDDIKAFLAEQIAKEPLTSVRCVFVDLLFPLFNQDREECGKFLIQLISKSPDKEKRNAILTSNLGIRLMQYVLMHAPIHGLKLLPFLLDSIDKKDKLIGAWLVFGASYEKEEYNDLYANLIKEGVEYKRLASQVAADAFGCSTFKNRAREHLISFFNDDDVHVRENASFVFRHIQPVELGNNKDIIEAYLNSKSALDDAFGFLRLLQDSPVNITEYILFFAELIVLNDDKVPNINQRRHRYYHYLNELLQKGYTDSENNKEHRKRYLDIIDQMLEIGVHGADDIAKTNDRYNS